MRALVALLLLANLGFLALARGWLQPYVGLSTPYEREPQRLAAQVDPDAVRVRAVGAAAAAAAACIEAGPFTLEQLEAAEAALAQGAGAAVRWQRQAVEPPGEAGGPMFRLRVEQADAALRQRLQDMVAGAPGGQLGACAPAR
jgi:hypothetical protein